MFTDKQFLNMLSAAWHRTAAQRDATPEGLEQDALDRQVCILAERWGTLLAAHRHPPVESGGRFDFYLPDDVYKTVMETNE